MDFKGQLASIAKTNTVPIVAPMANRHGLSTARQASMEDAGPLSTPGW